MNATWWWNVVKIAAADFLDDKAPRLGAALAYYAIFSMAPLLVIVIGIAGVVYGQRDAAQNQITGQIDALVGSQGGDAVRTMLQSAAEGKSGIVGSILGIAMPVFGATGLFGQLQDALNTVWEVEPKSEGLWGIVRNRFLSFTLILGMTFLLLLSLVVSAALTALGSLWGDWSASLAGQALHETISLVVIALLFAKIFRYLPDARIAWRDVWFGALVTSLLFTAGKFALGLYLGSSGLASGYGAAGSLAVLLVWLYYASQIFLFGAELTQAHAQARGADVEPKANARKISEQQRENEGLSKNKKHVVSRRGVA